MPQISLQKCLQTQSFVSENEEKTKIEKGKAASKPFQSLRAKQDTM